MCTILSEMCVCVCVCVMHLSYMSSEHAALSGLSNLCPFFRSLGRVTGSTPGYGILPPVKSSQHVTPYDHYTDDMAKGMLVRRTVLWVSCMGKTIANCYMNPVTDHTERDSRPWTSMTYIDHVATEAVSCMSTVTFVGCSIGKFLPA